MTLLDHPLISERYFFPRAARPRARLDVAVEGATLACALHRADPDGHAVVHFHGNGEVVADWQDGFDRVINRLGWDLLLAEYRGYGGSTGQPQLGRMLDDVAAVMAAAGPPERLVVFGRSVGSLFALEAVARCPEVAGLVLLLHARHDGLVDVSHAERLAAWAGGPASLRIFEEGDHNSILAENQEAYLDLLAAFLARARR